MFIMELKTNLTKVHNRLLLFLILSFVVFGCTSNKNVEKAEDEDVKVETTKDNDYASGTYCADVEYYNPHTGTTSNYTLNVEVEDNEVTRILFGNGGWLDSDHMTPQELDSDGTCTITSDKGYRYEIEIKGNECSFTHQVAAEKPPITLGEWAAVIGMTEAELAQYENEFKISRQQVISEKMCRMIEEYLPSWRSKNALDKAIQDGYIQKTYLASLGDIGTCNMAIVKRRGRYYLLEVAGKEKCSMGLMQFDPGVTEWQEAITQEDPAKQEWKVYQVHIVNESESIDILNIEMDKYCSN